MRQKCAQRLDHENEISDRQGNGPNDEPVSTNDSQSNGGDGNNNNVIIDMEGVEGDWESTRRTRRPPFMDV